VYILTKPVEETTVELLGRVYQDQPNYICKVLYLFESESSWFVFVEPIFRTLNQKLALEAPMPIKVQKHLK
jgi:hypothetical protein